MTKAEIVAFIKSRAWGTLIGVEGDKPYALEVSYGTDGTLFTVAPCGMLPDIPG
jgi:hypothetical protein